MGWWFGAPEIPTRSLTPDGLLRRSAAVLGELPDPWLREASSRHEGGEYARPDRVESGLEACLSWARVVAWVERDRILKAMSEEFEEDPAERAREKQRSREQDAQALRTGEKTRGELRRENGHFVFPRVRVSLRGARPLG